jgi:hypothetical protein
MINQGRCSSLASHEPILSPVDIGQRALAVIVTTRCDWASRSTAEKLLKQGARGAGLKTLRSNGIEVSVC